MQEWPTAVLAQQPARRRPRLAAEAIGPRAKPSRHARGKAAGKVAAKPHRGLDRAGHFKSKAQHRFAFATRQTWARGAAVRGRYKRLPPRVGRPTARAAR